MTDEKDTGEKTPATTVANDTAEAEKPLANGGSGGGGDRERDMMTSTVTDAWDACDDKPELTRFGKFCARHGINSNLIMLKITLFVMYGGKLLDDYSKWEVAG